MGRAVDCARAGNLVLDAWERDRQKRVSRDSFNVRDRVKGIEHCCRGRPTLEMIGRACGEYSIDRSIQLGIFQWSVNNDDPDAYTSQITTMSPRYPSEDARDGRFNLLRISRSVSKRSTAFTYLHDNIVWSESAHMTESTQMVSAQ
ncbi:hypothetical protein EVAR_6277_1 [Eumeta japonica]|uniref:Uncharacterized protein n=1 Tax=Eumeta variegata TaxID=151549 RepID=A0A4C1TB96_EUMVA|nr:hypothetical protein EVAR_6277_1 [Eumeta japonica]